jgi:release factor glutamine methyltransferase
MTPGAEHTIASTVSHAATRLARFPSARSDADELVSRLLGLGRADLLLSRDRPVTSEERNHLELWLERRLAGEPVQYITGHAAFRSLDLIVSPAVLIPRPETEGLVQSVLDAIRADTAHAAPRVLDLGTGSGAIALSIAQEWPAARVTATDRSSAALEVARANAERLGLASRVRWLHGDWLEPLGGDDLFEVIVSNPPYIATGEWDALPDDVRRFEPQDALFSGSSGLDALREIVDEAPRHLVAGGLLALELAEARAEEVAAWLDGASDWEGVTLADDLSGRPRVLIARRQRGPAIAPRQWPEDPEPGS